MYDLLLISASINLQCAMCKRNRASEIAEQNMNVFKPNYLFRLSR